MIDLENSELDFTGEHGGGSNAPVDAELSNLIDFLKTVDSHKEIDRIFCCGSGLRLRSAKMLGPL